MEKLTSCKKDKWNIQIDKGYKRLFYLSILFFILLAPTKIKSEIIFSYFFANSNINPNYLYNWQGSPPNYRLNSISGPANCDSTFYNDPAKDGFCITSSYGLIFPKSNSGYSYFEGSLDYSLIQAANPNYALLLRIFVDPTIVNLETHNMVKFILYFYCDHFNEIGFDIHFLPSGKIKIFVHTLLYDSEPECNGVATNFETVVPVLTVPTWVDAALYYPYVEYSHLPFYLTETIYQTCQFYSFNMENLNPLYSNDVDPIYGDLKYASLKIQSSQQYLTVIQYVGIFNIRVILEKCN